MKSDTIIKAIGSSGEPYDVHFEFSEKKLKVHCNCQAGIYGKLCKHKTGLLDCDSSFLLDKNDRDILQQIREVIKNSKYTEIINSYNVIKETIEAAQKKEKKLKSQIEQALKDGIDIL